MKKMFSKVLVLVLALSMVFALVACNDPDNGGGDDTLPFDTAGEAVSGAADATLKQDGITVTLDSSITLGGMLSLDGFLDGATEDTTGNVMTFNNMKVTGTFKLANGEKDADFDASISIPLGENNAVSFYAIKKGDKMYTSEDGENWDNEETEAIDLSYPTELKDVLGGLDFGDIKKTSDGYTLTAKEDFAATFVKIQNFLKDNGNKTVNAWLFPNNTPEQNAALAAGLEAALANGVTVGGMIEKIDELLEEGVTVKSTVDALLREEGITADDIYKLIKSDEEGDETPEPGANDTAYDYVYGMYKDYPVETLLQMVMGSMGGSSDEEVSPEFPDYEESSGIDPYAEDSGETSGDNQGDQGETGGDTEEEEAILPMLRSTLVAILTVKEASEEIPTINQLLDNGNEMLFNSPASIPLYMAFMLVCDPEVMDKVEDYPFTSAEIAKMTFGENKIEVTVTLNKDLTIKSIGIVVKSDIKYGEAKEQLVKVDVSVTLGFTYGAVTVTAPVTEQAA